ncbi:MAG: hypothetical protein KAW12_15625 [Candidatus Aminicenantes bacterium]|nr:hypothetical protein [Candidatus Aminicenantes bacterium]
MKKIILTLLLAALILPLGAFQGKTLKVGIVFVSAGNYVYHYGDLTFKKGSLLFEGHERDGKALEMFFELAYADIDEVGVTGDYANFMKLYIDQRSEFHKDHRFLLHGDDWLKADFIKIELRETENLREAWKAGKKFKKLIAANQPKK